MEFVISKPNKQDEEIETTWVKWYANLDKEAFTFTPTRIVFKEGDAPAFYLFNENKNEAVSVYCTHAPNSKYTNSTPDGVRLANAIGRTFKLKGSVEASTLVDSLNNTPCTIKVEKTEKGRLWQVEIIK